MLPQPRASVRSDWLLLSPPGGSIFRILLLVVPSLVERTYLLLSASHPALSLLTPAPYPSGEAEALKTLLFVSAFDILPSGLE